VSLQDRLTALAQAVGADVKALNSQVGTVILDTWHLIGSGGQPAFQNGWVNYAASNLGPVGFRKDLFGKVRLKGCMKSGTSNTVAFTLPVGYRPPYEMNFPVASAGAFGRVIIGIDGTVTPVGSNTTFFLDGIEFDLETVSQFKGPKGDKGDTGGNASFPMDTWHKVGTAGEPAFQNSWTNYGAAQQLAQFRKFPDGKVKLSGYIKGGATSTVAFTLPVGYRPPDQVAFICYASNGNCLVTVDSALDATPGGVRITQLGGVIATLTSLDNVEFDTESVTEYAVGQTGSPGPSTVNTDANSYFPSYDVAAPGMGYGNSLTTGRPDDDVYIFTSVETDDPDNSSPSGLMYVQTLIGVYSSDKIWRRYIVGSFAEAWQKISDTSIRATIRCSTAINVTNALETSVPFNVDEEDDWGFHTGSNIWMIVPTGAGYRGMYIASFECWYGSNPTNARYTRLYRDRGGVVTGFAADLRPGSAGGVSTIVHLTEPIDLLPGDKVWPSLYQNSGGTLSTAADTCRLKLVRTGNI
jgi:hypothetical protein